MPENITAENLLNNIMETISDNVQKQKSGSFFEEDVSNPVASQFNRLFGRQEPVHKVLGGGKCKLFVFFSFCLSCCLLYSLQYLEWSNMFKCPTFSLVCKSSCWCVTVEEQENLCQFFSWCYCCLGDVWMVELQFSAPCLLCCGSGHACSVSLVKCLWFHEQVMFSSSFIFLWWYFKLSSPKSLEQLIYTGHHLKFHEFTCQMSGLLILAW